MTLKAGLALITALVATDVVADPVTSFSVHAVRFRDDFNATEAFVRQSAARDLGAFDIIYGLSVSSEASLWAGVGVALTAGRNTPFYVEASFMPGLYAQGNGPDLGHVIEFRSGLEAGYRLSNGGRVGIGVDHRSNNGWGDTNPGLDTAYVRYSIRR